MRVLVTGATGFVGRELTQRLAAEPGVTVRAASRRTPAVPDPRVEYVLSAKLSRDADWSEALRNVDVVVHLAARVHVMRDTVPDSLGAFRRANVDGTLALARQAVAAGVSRFLFLSSIKVNGERTQLGRPYTAEDPPAPRDPYAMSKLEAELGLREIAATTPMEFTAIRSPLVYGPGVGANFQAMMRWLHRRIPLPLGAIENKRSLVALGNLVDLIANCTRHPAAANRVLLVCDGEDLSTTELLRRLGSALGRPARLIPVPITLLKLGAALAGRPEIARRLCDSLQVSGTATRELLAWEPPLSVEHALQATARHFLAHQSG